MLEYKLRDLIKINNGKDYKNEEKGDIPVYGTGGIIAYIQNKLSSEESILLPRKGSLKNIMYVNHPFWTVDTMYWTTVKKELANPKYLYYYLKLLDLSSLDSGSTLPSMTFDAYYELEIKLPRLEIQDKLVKILTFLDKKIEINNKINNNLEQQLKIIYDYYFNQFDFPDINGNPYKSSGGKMIWNPKLKMDIPINWTIKNIREITSLTWGQCPDGKNILKNTPEHQNLIDYCSGAGDMKGGFIVDCQAKTDNSKRFSYKNDILVSVAGKIGDMCIVDHTISLGRAALAFTANSEIEIPFIYFTLNMLNKKMITISSGSIQKVINNNHIDEFNFVYSPEIVEKFGEIATPLFTQLMQIANENKKLKELRDWMLPLLMNGQATISD